MKFFNIISYCFSHFIIMTGNSQLFNTWFDYSFFIFVWQTIMTNYTKWEIVDILLVLGECHKKQKCFTSLCWTLSWSSPSKHSQQVINIENLIKIHFIDGDNRIKTLIKMNKTHSRFVYDSFKFACQSLADQTWTRDPSINCSSHTAIH